MRVCAKKELVHESQGVISYSWPRFAFYSSGSDPCCRNIFLQMQFGELVPQFLKVGHTFCLSSFLCICWLTSTVQTPQPSSNPSNNKSMLLPAPRNLVSEKKVAGVCAGEPLHRQGALWNIAKHKGLQQLWAATGCLLSHFSAEMWILAIVLGLPNLGCKHLEGSN